LPWLRDRRRPQLSDERRAWSMQAHAFGEGRAHTSS
jgi:hypothetical protein